APAPPVPGARGARRPVAGPGREPPRSHTTRSRGTGGGPCASVLDETASGAAAITGDTPDQ
ncbi:MAG: cobalt-precorrin-5B (C(1))-methyltransferase, partial [Chloroflexota bacterium]